MPTRVHYWRVRRDADCGRDEQAVKSLAAVAAVIFLLTAILAYTIFQWGECRKDPDHTFWHCVQVMQS